MVSADRRPRYHLGIDLGGTNIKAGVVEEDGRPMSSVSLPTEAHLGPEHGVGVLAAVARLAVSESRLDWSEIGAVGLGSAGTLDTDEGRIIFATNLPLWRDFPIAPRLAERIERPTVLVNDANAAAFGEHWAGAGRSTSSLVLFTLGTGIGCGIVESGRIIEGRHGVGGECGHATIQMDGGRLCSCGRRGHLEAYASATALVGRAMEALESEPGSALGPLLSADALTSAALARCAMEGDPLASRLIRDTARYLAIGAANAIQRVDPDVVLFAGGMIAAGPVFLDAIREEIPEHVLPAISGRTRVDYASLGGHAGLIGAAGWARKRLSRD